MENNNNCDIESRRSKFIEHYDKTNENEKEAVSKRFREIYSKWINSTPSNMNINSCNNEVKNYNNYSIELYIRNVNEIDLEYVKNHAKTSGYFVVPTCEILTIIDEELQNYSNPNDFPDAYYDNMLYVKDVNDKELNITNKIQNIIKKWAYTHISYKLIIKNVPSNIRNKWRDQFKQLVCSKKFNTIANGNKKDKISDIIITHNNGNKDNSETTYLYSDLKIM